MERSLRATFRIHAVFFHITIQLGIVWRFHICLHYQIKFAIMYSENNSSQGNPMSETILTLNKIQQIVKPLAENTKSVKFIYSDHIHEKRRLLQAILIFCFQLHVYWNTKVHFTSSTIIMNRIYRKSSPVGCFQSVFCFRYMKCVSTFSTMQEIVNGDYPSISLKNVVFQNWCQIDVKLPLSREVQ